MPLNCPVCRAENTTGPNCRRCKADLTLLFVRDAKSAYLSGLVRKEAQAGRFLNALNHSVELEQIQPAEAAQLQAALLALLGDFPAAWQLYQGVSARG